MHVVSDANADVRWRMTTDVVTDDTVAY